MSDGRGASGIHSVLERHGDDLLDDWLGELRQSGAARPDRIRESELRGQCANFIRLLREALRSGEPQVQSSEWQELREMLAGVSRTWVQQGFTPTDIALFILSFKKPLFDRLRLELDPQRLYDGTWAATMLLDQLGLWTIEVYSKARDEIILRQQEELLELSTPVVKLWDGILALPMIGTLDSARTQVVMETLLGKIVETGSEIAILDITGIPTVDTLVAQHLLKTVAAARLMGAECIISGIRPQIAQTMVHLAIDLSSVTTKATLADAFLVALRRAGQEIRRAPGEPS